MASGRFDLNKLWVIVSEPRDKVDKRLMVVLTVAVDLLTSAEVAEVALPAFASLFSNS